MKKIFNITKLDHFGRGISRNDGKIIFIENALPKEEVSVTNIVDKKNISETTADEILKKSSDRRDTTKLCKYYGVCGGCNIMHMSYMCQLEFKRNKVVELMKKFAGIDESKIKDIIPSLEFEYRNKITLKVKEKIGLLKNKSYELVNIDSCSISRPKINEIIGKLNTLKFENIDEIVIRCGYNNESMVVFKCCGDIDIDYYLSSLKECTDTLVMLKDGIENVIFGKGYITEKLGKYYFKISPLSFFQVNTTTAEKLYDVVKEYASLDSTESVLDLYSGTGTIGIYLSEYAKSVLGVEINSEAVEDAKENVKLNNIKNAEFICYDIGKMKKECNNIDVAIVDPPRSGLSKKALLNISEIASKKLIYISCNPSTLARDLNLLKDKYYLKELTPVDMFPNTYHVECVCLLNLR